MIIHFNGVRGSIPYGESPQDLKNKMIKSKGSNLNFEDRETFIEYCGLGFHTTNIMIENTAQTEFLLVDGGSGIMSAANKIFKNYSRAQEINILQTHFHWDHLMGYNFFPQIYMGKTINIYSPLDDLEKNFSQMFKKPFFPVEYDFLKDNSEFNFFKVEPYKQYNISEFDFEFFKLDHPDPCWGPKITVGGRSYGHAIDTEGDRLTKASLGIDSGIYEDIDILHFDSPYLENEIKTSKKGWGHGSTIRAFKLAEEFNIPKITFGHYTPDVDYSKFKKIALETEKYFNLMSDSVKKSISYEFSYDGQIIDLS